MAGLTLATTRRRFASAGRGAGDLEVSSLLLAMRHGVPIG
jgi:hypothetical protein